MRKNILAITLTPLTLGFAISLPVENADAAKKASRIFSVEREAESEEDITYILRRESLEDKFRGKRSQIVTDEQLINQALKNAINKAREKALKKAYARCYDEFANCQEIGMEVVDTETDDVDTDTQEINNGLGLEVNKEVKAEATVRIEIRGDASGKLRKVSGSLPSEPKRTKQAASDKDNLKSDRVIKTVERTEPVEEQRIVPAKIEESGDESAATSEDQEN